MIRTLETKFHDQPWKRFTNKSVLQNGKQFFRKKIVGKEDASRLSVVVYNLFITYCFIKQLIKHVIVETYSLYVFKKLQIYFIAAIVVIPSFISCFIAT